MADTHNITLPLRGLDEGVALRSILEGTANETGERFFAALVENLAKALKTHGAWVTEYNQECRRLRALAFWMDGQWIQNYEVDIAGTPCEQVIDTANLVHFPDNLLQLFPDDPDVKDTGAVSYMGIHLKDIDGKILGHLAVIDRRPIPEEPKVLACFRIFAAQATAELQRLRAEKQVREREEKLRRLVGSAMDAIVEFDEDLAVTLINPAAEQVFQCDAEAVTRHAITQFLLPESQKRLMDLIQELDARIGTQRSLWIPGGLKACRADESEFFGHEKGAFTGATQRREGRFALADRGTIFLDEIGELSLDLQAKPLRVLQEGEFALVGSSQTKKVDVRVIAATNCNLDQYVRDGKFREDLYYRLNVFPIRIPPLRERGDDVVLLASAFLERFRRELRKPQLRLTADAKKTLSSHHWPGNVRELQNVIERAAILNDGAIEAAYLGLSQRD